MKDDKHNSLHRLSDKSFVLFIRKLIVFLERRSQKAVCFSEQIMSADKYPSIFSRQMAAVYVTLTDSSTVIPATHSVIAKSCRLSYCFYLHFFFPFKVTWELRDLKVMQGSQYLLQR